MTEHIGRDEPADEDDRASRRVRLPGFIGAEDIGLGDVVKRATSYFGIRACGGCEQRRIALNRLVAFTGGRRRT
jgi:hypothetical protein